MTPRQWPEVCDLCHTFLHVARVRKHTDMRELYAFRVQFSHALSRAILTCPCVFCLAQRAKTCDKIWCLWPLPNDTQQCTTSTPLPLLRPGWALIGMIGLVQNTGKLPLKIAKTWKILLPLVIKWSLSPVTPHSESVFKIEMQPVAVHTVTHLPILFTE